MKRSAVRYVYVLLVLMFTGFIVSGCGGDGNTGHWDSGEDTILPTVTATVPVNGATAVAIGNNLTATFSEAMDPLTITDLSFTLTDGVTPVTGVVSYTGVTAVFNPTVDLDPATVYTATISTVAEDLAGNPLASDYVWSFTTGAILDTIVPTVTSTVPVNNATAVAIGNNLTATFSEAMEPLTITALSFTLADGVTPVTGAVSYSGVTAVFNPAVDLEPATVYTATISTVAADLAGNPLASDHVWSFTTGAALDIIAPTVMSTVPVDEATAVAIGSNLTATFSEAMDPSTITNVNFTLADDLAADVPGSVTYSGVTAVFNPAADLAPDTTYTATISTVAADLAGNPLASDFAWSFTTGVAPDTFVPTVTITSPDDLDTDVIVNKTLTATFSEAMDPSTITNVSFTLADALSADVTGLVTYTGFNAAFNPTVDLEPATVYTATISTVATDLAGNPLASDYVWSFTTVSAVGVGPQPVDLGLAENFAGLSKAGITDVPSSDIIGDIGASPISGAAIGVTCAEVTGTIYAVDAAGPAPCSVIDPVMLTTAVSNLETAYTDAAGRPAGVGPNLNLGAGTVAGQTLAPGTYTWGSNVTITTDLTLNGGPNDTWLFQITGTLDMSPNMQVLLSGGALAKNIFWQVSDSVTLGTGSHFEGNILAQTNIAMNTGASINGRLLAQTGVSLDQNTIIIPAP